MPVRLLKPHQGPQCHAPGVNQRRAEQPDPQGRQHWAEPERPGQNQRACQLWLPQGQRPDQMPDPLQTQMQRP